MTGVNNWRTALSWPEHVSLTHSEFSRAKALAAMLLSEAVFLNSNWWEEMWPDDAKKTVAVCVDTNDVFAWGCADAETITYHQIDEVYRYWAKDPLWGCAVWAIILKREMPQRPVEQAIRRAGVWDFDALKAEHNLRANRYDGVSSVLAKRKREAYLRWSLSVGLDPLPYDGGWWQGWKEYVAAYPGWYDDEWKAEDKRLIEAWQRENGFPPP